MRISDWSSDVCSSDLTVGFLMNEWRADGLEARLAHAKAVNVTPLCMEATTIDGEQHRIPAINEVSLLRETRQTAKLEVTLNGRIVLPELACDGVLCATPAGSTAYKDRKSTRMNSSH